MYLLPTEHQGSQALMLGGTFGPSTHLYVVDGLERQPLFLQLPRIAAQACKLLDVPVDPSLLLALRQEPWAALDVGAQPVTFLEFHSTAWTLDVPHEASLVVDLDGTTVLELAAQRLAEVVLELGLDAQTQLGNGQDGSAMMALPGNAEASLALRGDANAAIDLNESDCP